jgi:hypothetical protein
VTSTPTAASRVEAFLENVRLYNEDREAWAAALPEHAVLVTDPLWPDGGRFEGREAWLEFLRKWEEAWSSIHYQVDDAEQIGEAVVARSRWIVRGTSSEIDTEVSFSAVVRIDEQGGLRSSHFFFDHDRALEFARSAAP